MRWTEVHNVESLPHGGVEIHNDALSEALLSRTEFTRAEWAAFGVDQLRMGHFIRTGEVTFTPAAAASRPKQPLYLQRKAEADRKEAEEARRREAALQARRQRFQPIEFVGDDVDLPAQLYEAPKEGRHILQAHAKASDVALPPINQVRPQYYQGKARERVVAELKSSIASATGAW